MVEKRGKERENRNANGATDWKATDVKAIHLN